MGDSANTQGNNYIDFEYDDDDTAITKIAGERRHIKFGPAPETDSTYKYNGILTCLKPGAKLYSFSILIDNDNDDILSSFIKTLSNSNDIKIVDKKTNNKYIYNFTNSSTDLNNVFQGTNDNYMLIIGELEDDKRLKVLKIILISNNNISSSINTNKYYTDLLTAEEYLNLYYIEHFSLNIPKFISDKYNPYRKSIQIKNPTSSRTGEGGGEEGGEEGGEDKVAKSVSGDINEAITMADGLFKEVIHGELDKFHDGEGAVGPVTGDNGNGEIADGSSTVVPSPGSQGGGKKLASKVKKIKNKKK